MAWDARRLPPPLKLGGVAASILLCGALALAMFAAPTETTMGHAQRILYIHVAAAWLGLFGFAVMGVGGIAYLSQRNLAWEDWSHAANEIGWLCSSLTLLTGAIWARSAWGVWWVWDPRLTTMFMLWTLYSSCLVLRSGVEAVDVRARIASTLAILGMIDLPFVIMATRWFRGIHPVSPAMEPGMRIALFFNVAAFTLFFGVLLIYRQRQLAATRKISEFEQQALTRRRNDNCLVADPQRL